MPVGRNDPCPCGSGKKYKHCCLQAQDVAEERWLGWRQAEGVVVPAVANFAAETWGEAILEEAAQTFFVEGEPPASDDNPEAWEQLFLPWFAFDFVPEPRRRWGRRTAPDWPATILAIEYARRHGNDLSPVEARFLRAASDAPLSFMAVTGVDAGRSLELKDILTGEAHRVIERSATAGLEPGQIILARVVPDGDIAVMSGLGPYPLFPSDHNVIIDFRENFLKPRAGIDRAKLKERSLEVVLFYRQLVGRVLNPQPPQLQNTDGDRLEPTTLEFELRCGVREAFDRLASLSVIHSAEDMLEDATFSDAGDLTKVTIEWGKRGNKMHRDWDNTTLGHLTLEGGAISVSVNSVKRAKKIRGLIEKRLGCDVLYLRQTIESADVLLDPSRRDVPVALEDPDVPALGSTPEGRAYIEELNRRHWQAWLDEKVPALGNLTPREAARTRLGRERLDALLTEYAWRQHASPHNVIRFDGDWVRRELALPEPG